MLLYCNGTPSTHVTFYIPTIKCTVYILYEKMAFNVFEGKTMTSKFYSFIKSCIFTFFKIDSHINKLWKYYILCLSCYCIFTV